MIYTDITDDETKAMNDRNMAALKAEISHKDLMEIEQILHRGLASAADAETKRFWDGYSMCLHNFSKALVTIAQRD